MPAFEILIFEYESTLASYNKVISDILSSGTTTVSNYSINGLPLLSSITSSDCLSSCTSNDNCAAAVQVGQQTCNLYSFSSSVNDVSLISQAGDTLFLKNNSVKLYLLLKIIDQLEGIIIKIRSNSQFSENMGSIATLLASTEAKLILDKEEIMDLIHKSDSITNDYNVSTIQTTSNYTLYNFWFYCAITLLLAAIASFIFVLL